MAVLLRTLLSMIAFLMCRPVLGSPKNETRLHRYLFNASRYNTYVRPVLDPSCSVNITFHKFYLYCIMDLDEKLQVMKSSGWLTMTWTDDLLTWNTTEYGGIHHTLASQDMVWKPDIVVNNAVDTVSKGLGFSGLAAKIFYNGTVLWEPGDVFQTLCIVDVSHFPFDTQYCVYEFSTWMYLRGDINVTVMQNSIDMRFYHENGEWEVIETNAAEFDQSYDPYAGALYQLTLRRRRGVYILNIIIPIILLSFLNSFVFILPAESGEKTALCVTSMLSFMVYLSSIVDMVPKTSIKMPLIVVYLVIMLSFSAISVIFTVIVLFTYQKQSSKLPACLQFLIRFRSCLKSKRSDYRRKNPHIVHTFDANDGEINMNKHMLLNDINIIDKDVRENGTEATNTGGCKERGEKRGSCLGNDSFWHSGSAPQVDANSWKVAAETLDRIFFYCVFSLSTLVSFVTVSVLAFR